ncbi:hypothetical protein B9Z55_023726 [Caenorhabditis nigoni]|uniref:Tc1-like transposase DDE domain-containing protein n=1 Tax=Caenorhabditis nigoni TaxID=1611254 RepID=A0A2G5SRA7_9PELO|nr:hypothetical protein B9Z55_023726 [Caenorhabditis nigoni]
MGRGKPLTDFEKGQITAKNAQGLSNRQIAQDLGKSLDVVNRFVKDPSHYGTKNSPGRPSLLTIRDKRQILRKASNAVTTCTKIKSDLNLSVSNETVRRVIQKSNFIKYRKMKKAPKLTSIHRQKRLEFARKNARTDWTQIIFSDEKKFNCDGPDGYNSYWHDLRKDRLRFSRRNFKGGGCMVWAAISSDRRVKLFFCTKKMDGSEYRNVLRRGLLPFFRRNRNKNYQFMQDGAPCHRARQTMKWLEDHRIPVLTWPACSPDLNIIENVWAFMARKVYEGNKSYDNVDQLKKAIIDAWLAVDQNLLDNLYRSLDGRVYELTLKGGGHIKY